MSNEAKTALMGLALWVQMFVIFAGASAISQRGVDHAAIFIVVAGLATWGLLVIPGIDTK